MNYTFNEELLYTVPKYNVYLKLAYYRMLKKRKGDENELIILG